jgi:hypothetical protein
MKQVGPRPALEALVDELLGQPYQESQNCWWLVRHLFERGRGVHLDVEADLNALVLHEVWFRDDARPVLEVVQPWDGLVFTVAGPLADHAGIVINAEYFVHSRVKIGVCKEPLQKWSNRLLQVVRVQARG